MLEGSVLQNEEAPPTKCRWRNGAPLPAPALYDPADMLALHQAIDQLDPQRRRIVQLKFYFGLSHPQIAEVLGLATDHDQGKMGFRTGPSLSGAQAIVRGESQ